MPTNVTPTEAKIMKIDHGLYVECTKIDVHQQQSLEHHRDALVSILDKARADVAKIAEDRGLNNLGRQQKTTKVLDAASEELRKVNAAHARNFVPPLEDAKKKIPTAIAYPGKPRPSNEYDLSDDKVRKAVLDVGDRIVRQMQENQITEHLSGLDPLERNAALQSAAEQGDFQTILAAKNAPALLRTVDPAVIADAEQRYLRKVNPEPFAAHEAAQEAFDAFNSNSARAYKSLGRPESDPVKAEAAA